MSRHTGALDAVRELLRKKGAQTIQELQAEVGKFSPSIISRAGDIVCVRPSANSRGVWYLNTDDFQYFQAKEKVSRLPPPRRSKKYKVEDFLRVKELWGSGYNSRMKFTILGLVFHSGPMRVGDAAEMLGIPRHNYVSAKEGYGVVGYDVYSGMIKSFTELTENEILERIDGTSLYKVVLDAIIYDSSRKYQKYQFTYVPAYDDVGVVTEVGKNEYGVDIAWMELFQRDRPVPLAMNEQPAKEPQGIVKKFS